MEGEAEEKMDEEQLVEERSARVARKLGEPTLVEERSSTCRSATGVSTPSRAERPTQLTGSQRERRTNRRWRSTTSSLRRRRTGGRSWAHGHHHHGNLLWKGRSRCYAVREGRYRLLGSVLHGSACGWGSRFRSSGAESRPRDEPHDLLT